MSEMQLKDNPTLADLQDYVRAMVTERGFDGETVAQRFMLLLEETGEFAKAARKAEGMKFAADTETKEVAHEAADVFIILLGLCNMLNIDLEQAFREKEEHNKKRIWQ
ncbi:MAG TPA: MazG nucleotide pyrophosphohydrolase domain-containing protein [Candidatus Saccharimonadales bacterium]